MKQLFCICLALAIGPFVFSQASEPVKDTTKAVDDSAMFKKFFAVAQYPLIKSSKWSGIIPVSNPTEVPDHKMDYKLLFELTYNNPDSLSKEISNGLAEIGRIINLHAASGIPAKHIKPVILIHGPSLNAIMNNEAYQKKFKVDNPNLAIIKEFEQIGTKFIACGQAMAFFGFNKEDLLPEVKISVTAQTVLSGYQEKGYVRYLIDKIN